jgi:ribonuclease R
MISDSTILRKIERQPKQSAGFKQLVRELGVRGNERRALASRLDDLVRRGNLVESSRGQYSLPHTANKDFLIGRLSLHRDGYGFVLPERGPAKNHVNGDVFINPHSTGTTMHGDRVMVEVTARRADGRAEGRIIRVIGRAHLTVVGTFHYGPTHNYIVPIDEKITRDVIIPHGLELPKGLAAGETRGHSRHRVLGQEVARRAVDWDNLEGVVVDVEITDWPTATQNPRGRVIEVLGYEDDFGVDVEIIIRKYHLPHRFPPEVLAEAQEFSPSIAARELAQRRDFRHLPVITIDGETARDFDDAVYVCRQENGNYELQVHIADVAHYVTPSSPLDEEARLRGTSVYFPDRAVPMLPVELSTDLCSLRPQVDRLVLSCWMEIDRHGEVLGYEIGEGVIRSAERMTYTDVNAILEGDTVLSRRYAPLLESLSLMRELAVLLNRKRERRGAIDFDLPEPEVEFDEFGLMRAITRSERNFAHRLIEEFMLAANECVAGYLENKQIPSLYRIHEKPDPRKVLEFEQIAAGFGYSLGIGALPVQRFRYTDDRRPRRREGRGDRGGQRRREVEIPEDLPVTPRMYQKLIKKIAGTAEERILSYLMLRSLKQARYAEENAGHFALAAPTYTHFTSPIRRYPDLVVHRIVKQVLREPGANVEYDDKDKEELHDIAEESSQSERRADDAERELMEWKKVKFMAERVGEDFDALIVNVTKFGFFVELTDMFIEGLVPLSSLTDDAYVYHDSTKEIIGARHRKTYSVGGRLRVLVDRIDPLLKKIQFAVMPDLPPRREKRRKKT